MKDFIEENGKSRKPGRSKKSSKGSHKCPYCNERFEVLNGRGGLLNHKKTKHFWGKFKCLECPFIAHFSNELIVHKQKKGHIEDPYINCAKCKDPFHMNEITAHYEQCVTEDCMKCPVCPKRFSGPSGGTLDQHRKTKHFWGVFR